MTTSRIITFDAHPQTVFEALLEVAAEMKTIARILDAKARQVIISRNTRSFRISASVTDNGRGRTTLHLSWTPPTSPGASKCAKRLIKATGDSLKQMAAPPPPAPSSPDSNATRP